jgi:hypothetical protein
MKAKHKTLPLVIHLRQQDGQALYIGRNQNESLEIAKKHGYRVVPGKRPLPKDNYLTQETRTETGTTFYHFFKYEK